MDKLTNWIGVYDNALPDDLCDWYINTFEASEVPKGEYNEHWRRCKECSIIDGISRWDDLKRYIKNTYDKYREEHKNSTLYNINTIEAPNLYRYDVDPKNPNIFNPHVDAWNFATATRQISIIIYLNEVIEGGATTFNELDISITPKKGRILFFPSSFNFFHKGDAPISNSKYIIVSWLHFDGSGHAYRVHHL